MTFVNPGRFARLDEVTDAEWDAIELGTTQDLPQVAERVLAMLASLERIQCGFSVDQLEHALQTATRAERAGASTELIVAALCHDIGKAISTYGHAAISAAILAPYVSAETHWIIAVHQHLQARHYRGRFGSSAAPWTQHEGHALYADARRFVDEWDQTSFERGFPHPPLAYFEPYVREVFALPTKLR